VQVSGAGGLKLYFAKVKEIEHASETISRPERALGDGFDASKLRCEPAGDEARFSELNLAQEYGRSAVHERDERGANLFLA
jgi:hypothetical protein